MATFDYHSLKKKYGNFSNSFAQVEANRKNLKNNKEGLVISDIEVELTSGYEASIATFHVYNCYNPTISQFETEALKKYFLLGVPVKIAMGYGNSCREVFRGFIAQIRFFHEKEEVPGVEITAMDVKGIMMANNHSKQLKAVYFSDAVNEILGNKAYTTLQTNAVIDKLDITSTPDKSALGGTSQQNKASDRTIEMVCESDYEFVVKAAKKYNFEFFSLGGTVYFRKAKDNKDILMEIGPDTGLTGYEISYDITGLTETIEVRGMDAGKAQMITASGRLNEKISQGSKARALLSKSKKTYIDPTISSKKEADYRLEYLKEEMSFRYGSLEARLIGLPELIPGRFIRMKELGNVVSNTFYISSVTHSLNTEDGFVTRITGKASGLNGSTGGKGGII